MFARVGIAITLATAMAVLPRCHELLKQRALRPDHSSRFFPAMAGNLCAFLTFYELSALVLEGPRSRVSDEALTVAWGLTLWLEFLFEQRVFEHEYRKQNYLEEGSFCLRSPPALRAFRLPSACHAPNIPAPFRRAVADSAARPVRRSYVLRSHGAPFPILIVWPCLPA